MKTSKKDGKTHTLTITVDLSEGAWFAGPLDNDIWKGKFTVSLKDQNHVKLKSNILINPLPYSGRDHFENKPMQMVKENSTLAYEFEVISTADFIANGTIQFVIEPQCTMEIIPFTISLKNGQIKVQRAE